MSWEIHPAKSSFFRFSEEWDRLNAELYDAHPYFDSRFIGPLLDCFANGKEQLCIYRSNGVVSGSLILQPDGLGRWSSFQPSQVQVSALLLTDANHLNELLPALPGFAWTIELYAIDPRFSPDFSQLQSPQIKFDHANTIGIKPEIGFSDYWNKRSKNLKSNVRRYFNRLNREGVTPSFSRVSNTIETGAAVARFGELETAGWKGEVGTAVSMLNKQGPFYAEVLGRFAQSDQATVYELRIGDQLAASRLVISNDQMLVILKTAYDESLARFAPGRILLFHIIQEELDSQLGRTIEFYTNATSDQEEWANFGCTIQNLQVFKSDFFAIAFSILKGWRQVLKGVDSIPTKIAGPGKSPNVKSFTSTKGDSAGQFDRQAFSARDNIESSIDWFELLQDSVYPDDSGVRYYFLADKNKLSTILPLRLTNEGHVRTVESMGNYYTSLYSPLLSDDSDLLNLKYALASASRDHGGAHVMRFAPMDPESPAYNGLLNELRAIGWIPFKFFCFGNWFLTVDFNWEEYLKKRSANLRSSIKRRSKDFVADGGTLEVVSNADDVEQAIAAFQEVYTASWKLPEPYPDFVPSLIRQLSTKGMLRLGIARMKGRPIAAQLWIVGQSKASIYKVAYHKAFSSLSPGTVLTSHLLKHVIDQDHVKEVDFLIGDDEYKKIWMSDRRERWGIVAYNPRTVIGFALLIKEIGGRVAKILKKMFKEKFLEQRQLGTHANGAVRLKVFEPAAPSPREQVMIWTIRPIAQFADFKIEWDALVQSRPGTPFLESAFLLPLLDVFGSGEELLCLLHSHGQLCAAAIMQRRQKGVWQTFQPSQLPLGAWVTNGNVDLISACDDLVRWLPGLTLGIGASQIDPRIQSRPDDSAKVRTQDYIQTAWVDIEGSFESYWEARGKNLKQNSRKQRNKLLAEGIEIRIECITAPEDVNKAIEDYGSLESAGWKATDGTAILPDNAQGHFYRKMLENFCSIGRGRIYRYWFDDKVVAMDLCIHDDAAIVILKTAYDESYKAVSPSTLMRQDEFQQLFHEQKFHRIEFYGKVMEWHTRWTTQNRTLYHVTEYRWAWLKELHARMSAPAEGPSQETSSPMKT